MSNLSTSAAPRAVTGSRRRPFVTRAGRTLDFTSLGFGSAPLGNYLRPLSEEDCNATLNTAWDLGIRYFDTAPFYGLGLSEMRVGRMLRSRPRQEYLLATKAGRVLDPCSKDEVNGVFFVETPQVHWSYDYSYDGVMRSYEDSRKRLGIERVDILYIHDVCGLAHGGREASEARIRELIDNGGWRAMDELRARGDVVAIGAGVNEWEPCARLLELVDPDIFLLAGRYTLLEQAPLHTLFPECRRRGVCVVAGGPYNSGILAGGTTWNYDKAPAEIMARARALDAECRAFGVELPAAALQFILAHPVIACVIPGGQNVKETLHNAAVLDATIPAALWQSLKDKNLIDPEAPTPDQPHESPRRR